MSTLLVGCSNEGTTGGTTTTVTATESAAPESTAPAAGDKEKNGEDASTSTSATNSQGFDAATAVIDGTGVFHGLKYTNYADDFAGLSDNERSDLSARGQQVKDGVKASDTQCATSIVPRDYVTGLVAKDPHAVNVATWSPMDGGGEDVATLIVGDEASMGEIGVMPGSCQMFTATQPVGEAGSGTSATLNYKNIPIPNVRIDGAGSVSAYKQIVWAEGNDRGPDQHHTVTVRAVKNGVVVVAQCRGESQARKLVQEQINKLG